MLSVLSQISQAKQPARSGYTSCNSTAQSFSSLQYARQSSVMWSVLGSSILSAQFEGFFLNKFVRCGLCLAFHYMLCFFCK
jgi:hypothetical protein